VAFLGERQEESIYGENADKKRKTPELQT